MHISPILHIPHVDWILLVWFSFPPPLINPATRWHKCQLRQCFPFGRWCRWRQPQRETKKTDRQMAWFADANFTKAVFYNGVKMIGEDINQWEALLEASKNLFCASLRMSDSCNRIQLAGFSSRPLGVCWCSSIPDFKARGQKEPNLGRSEPTSPLIPATLARPIFTWEETSGLPRFPLKTKSWVLVGGASFVRWY